LNQIQAARIERLIGNNNTLAIAPLSDRNLQVALTEQRNADAITHVRRRD